MSNIMWHTALKPGTTEMQDVILADVDPNDYETIGTLLSTNILTSWVIETEQSSYLLISDGECERPYPSVMIWRVEVSREEINIVKNLMILSRRLMLMYLKSLIIKC